MARQPAKVLGAVDLRRLLQAVAKTRHPVRNHFLVLLSFHAGLRACEISGLTWPMVLGPSGKLSDSLSISGGIAKGGRSRCVPISLELRAARRQLHRHQGKPNEGPAIQSERGQAMTAPLHRKLVSGNLRRSRPLWVLVALGTPNLHHAYSTAAVQDGRLFA